MPPVVVRKLGVLPYEPVWRSMQLFTIERGPDSPDEIWLLQHEPVFTQGQAGKPEHLLMPGDIPIVAADRGGQVTYHGPGQLIIYLLLQLKRYNLGVRQLVTLMEESLVATLNDYQIDAYPKPDAPGVYVAGDKIASLGLRVRRGCSFHGLALNVAMDLEPFNRINPCGYAGLAMTHMAAFSPEVALNQVSENLLRVLLCRLSITEYTEHNHLE